MKVTLLPALFFTTLIAFFARPLAAEEKRAPVMYNADLNGRDLQFLMQAAEQGLLQANMAALAKNHAQSTEVKEFADGLARHCAAQNEQLRKIALENGIALPNTLTRQQTALIGRLGKLSGMKFDKAFMAEMTQAQQGSEGIFEQTLQLENPEIIAFAAQTLPSIKQQLALARNISGIAPRAGTMPHFRIDVARPGA